MRWYHKISVKMPALILLAATLPLLAFGTAAVRLAHVGFQQEAARANREAARLMLYEIESSLGDVAGDLSFTAGLLTFTGADYEEQAGALRTLIETASEVETVTVLDEQGNERVKLTRDQTLLSQTLDKRMTDPGFAQAIQGLDFVGPVSRSIDGIPTVVVAVPIWNTAHDRTVGVLQAEISLHRLLSYIQSLETGVSGYVLVLDQDGTVIVHPDSSQVLIDSDFSSHPLLQDFLMGEPTGEAHIVVNFQGVKVLSVAVSSPDLGWIVIVDQPLSEALAPASAMERGLAAALGAVVLLASALSGYFVWRLVKPLQSLEAGTQRVAAGELSHTIDIRSPDEIGRLAHAFNKMTASLRRSREQVNRTQHLLLALSQAGLPVQRARTAKEVYQAMGKEMVDLGYQAFSFKLGQGGACLELVYAGISPELAGNAEIAAGLESGLWRIPVSGDNAVGLAVLEQRGVFCADLNRDFVQALPEPVRPIASQIMESMAAAQGICIPLVAKEKVVGMVEVGGPGLSKQDLPALAAFANQASTALENAALYEALADHFQQLEKRVAERTSELDQARLAALDMMTKADQARKQAEESEKIQRQLAENLVRSNADLEQFAYVASHDLQEPLRAITGYLQILQRRYGDQMGEEADMFIDRAVAGALRMKALIQALLSYSRLGSRGQAFSPTDMERVLKQACANLSQPIQETQARLSHDPLPIINGDSTQMLQLMENLINNAIKFRKPAVWPHIHIGAQKTRDDQGNPEWFFSVQDNGIGIDPKYNERIFRVFQRLHTRDKYEGTGIGLSICKKIVERHGGRIWLEGKPGQGTIFYFSISIAEEKES